MKSRTLIFTLSAMFTLTGCNKNDANNPLESKTPDISSEEQVDAIEVNYEYVALDSLLQLAKIDSDILIIKSVKALKLSDSVFVFNTVVSSKIKRLENREVQFSGDLEDLKRVYAELAYINIYTQGDGLEKAVRNGGLAYDGAKDSLISTLTGLYDLGKGVFDISNPTQIWDDEARLKSLEVHAQIGELGESISKLKAIAEECNWEKDKIEALFSSVFSTYWDVNREEIANVAGFTQEQLWFKDVSLPLLNNETKARVGGKMLPELALMALPLAKLTKLTKTEKITDALKAAKSKTLTPLVRGAKRNPTTVSVALIEKTQPISNLVNPVKLATIKADSRAANEKFYQLMFHTDEMVKTTGKSPKQVIAAIYENVPKKGYANSSQVFCPAVAKLNILAQYRYGQKLGLFDTKENLAKMKKGRAPTIMRGDDAGRITNVDHLIPKSCAPELENSFSNLTFLSDKKNNEKSDKIVNAAIRRMREIDKSKIGWKASDELKKRVDEFLAVKRS